MIQSMFPDGFVAHRQVPYVDFPQPFIRDYKLNNEIVKQMNALNK